jgi:hypothetical protein
VIDKMAESVSLPADLQILATGARQTCTGLLRTIKDVKATGLEEFKKELEELATTLHSLTIKDTDLSELCRNAAKPATSLDSKLKNVGPGPVAARWLSKMVTLVSDSF